MYSDTLARYLTSTSLFPFQQPSFEAARISPTLFPHSLHFVRVYKPPPSRKNKLTDATFHDTFPDLLDFCNNLSGNCIILGDMNVYFDSPNNPRTAKLLNSLDMFNFSQALSQRMSVVMLLIGLCSDQKTMCYVLPLLLRQSLLITSVLLFPLTLLCIENLAIYVR